MKPEQNQANAYKLAREIIHNMDSDGVYEYAISKLAEYYLLPENKEQFELEVEGFWSYPI